MLIRSFVCLSVLLTLAVSAIAGAPKSVVVFAGSASHPPLEEAVEVFQMNSGIPVILHLGGSGTMLNQIRLTGQGDLYIPGSPDYMEKARSFGLIDGPSRIIAYLIPALIVAKGNPLRINGLGDLQRAGLRIGIADPNGVCVGLYAVEILEANSITDEIQDNLRGMVESCSKTAAMIPLNLVDVVLGWREFASWNPETMDVVLLDPGQIPRLAYVPASVLRNAENPKGAEAFMAFLGSEEGQTIFQKHGYLTDEDSARKFAPGANLGGTYTLPESW